MKPISAKSKKSKRSKPFALVALAVACLLAVAVGQDSTAPPADTGTKTENIDYDAIAKQKLAGVAEKIDFKNTPLEEAIQYLRETSGLNIFVKWGALEAPGIDKQTTVNVHLENVTYESALKYMLEDASGGTANLGYVIADGVVVISIMEDLNRRTVTRIYPVGDLINQTRVVYAESCGWLWLRGVFVSKDGLDMEDNDCSFWSDEEDYAYPLYIAAAKKLVRMICATVDPYSWRPDGEVGSIELFGTNLVITQTRANHEAVARLLDGLRSDRTISVGVAVVRMSAADSQKKLDELVSKGGDIKAALLAGERKGLWTLDRCELEQAAFGEIIASSQVYEHVVEKGGGTGDGTYILELSENAGYQIGVLAKQRTDGGAVMSVACGSGWHPRGHDPRNDTPEKNAGVTKRHNMFDFTLAAGEVKTFSVIPFDVCGDAAVAVVWLPEAAEK